MSLSKRSIRRSVIGLTGAAAIGLAVFGVGSTGADFTASDTGNVSVQTGNLSIELSDDDATGTFQLAYPNLAPGDTKVDQFTVKNTGSIAADVKIGGVSLGAQNLNGLTGAQLNLLKASIDGYQATAPVSSLSSTIQLGTLNPGQSRTYTVRVSLDQSAGNEWQNRNIAAGVTVTLSQ